jgi:hypothetical protein
LSLPKVITININVRKIATQLWEILGLKQPEEEILGLKQPEEETLGLKQPGEEILGLKQPEGKA